MITTNNLNSKDVLLVIKKFQPLSAGRGWKSWFHIHLSNAPDAHFAAIHNAPANERLVPLRLIKPPNQRPDLNTVTGNQLATDSRNPLKLRREPLSGCSRSCQVTRWNIWEINRSIHPKEKELKESTNKGQPSAWDPPCKPTNTDGTEQIKSNQIKGTIPDGRELWRAWSGRRCTGSPRAGACGADVCTAPPSTSPPRSPRLRFLHRQRTRDETGSEIVADSRDEEWRKIEALYSSVWVESSPPRSLYMIWSDIIYGH